MNVVMKCKRCGGAKFIGDDYYAFGEIWVDVSCVQCGHSKDIQRKRLDLFLIKLSNARREAKARNANQ